MNLPSNRLKIICFMLIIIGFVSGQSKYPTFEEWARSYNKTYKNDQQREFRKAVFEKNIEKIIISNSNPQSTFTSGVNFYTDWLEEQTQRLRGLLITPRKQRKSSHNPQLLSSNLRSAPTIDHRKSGIITSVKNQRSCGSCWAFTAASLAESFTISQGRQNISVDLSEQYLIECTKNNSGCNGGIIQRGLDQANTSCPLEQTYKYTNGNSYYGSKICEAQGISTKFKRQSFYDLNDGELIRLLAIGPLGVAVNSQNWKDYKSGIITCTKKQVDHAVVAVGYTQNSYIIKNSWGKRWGEDGYVHVSRDPQNNCGITHQAHLLVKSSWQYINILNISVMVFVTLIFTV